MRDILDLLEASFKRLRYEDSFLMEKMQKYEGGETYSFKIFEFLHDDFNNKQLQITNPKIDTASHAKAKVHISLIPKQDLKKIHVQIIHFSFQLFEDLLQNQNQQFLSNIIYLKVL